MSWPARYVVHDDDGPIRTFWTRQEAVNWMCSRGDFWLEVIPMPSRSERQAQMLREAGEAVF
jgi:hypothetical protein